MTSNNKNVKANAVLEELPFFAIDLAVMACAFILAHMLRFNFHEPGYGWSPVATYWIPVVALQVIAFRVFGCHHIVWRFFGAYDVPRLVFAASSSTALLVLAWFATRSDQNMLAYRPPVSVSLINGALFIGGAMSVRMLWRLMSESRARAASGGPAASQPVRERRVLLIGAGSIGNNVAHEIQQNRSRGRMVAGFLDDDPTLAKSIIQGARVLGPVSSLRKTVRKLGIDEVLITIASVKRDTIRSIVHECGELGVDVRIAPGYYEVLDGTLSVSMLREVDVADLLGRDEVDIASDAELARFVTGRSVVVTGAGGSIGSEFVRQIVRLGPSRIVLIERSEPALYQIDRELRKSNARPEIIPVAADIADRARIAAVFAKYRPELLVNAAAHKHVPMMECNVAEAVRNNVLATRALGEEAIKAGVKVFVQLSTDKAVNPSSVMGASKRLAEFAIQDLNSAGVTRFAAVRFGNVLGASGSVIPLFREQIRAGGPVTVTHPDMRRYFMTIPEACRLVLRAASIADGGEIFILDMGEPMKIVELAEEMIRLSGFKPYEDIKIVFTGLRPGEKLFEELSTNAEHATRTRLPRIFIGRIDAPSAADVSRMLTRFGELCGRAADDDETRQTIAEFVPENTFQSTVVP